MRHRVRDGPVRLLHVANVTNEIGIECGHIEVHHGLFPGHLGIAHPALTLVALIAIGGNAEEIRKL